MDGIGQYRLKQRLRGILLKSQTLTHVGSGKPDHSAYLTAQGFGYGIDVLCGTLGDDFTVSSENKIIEVKL